MIETLNWIVEQGAETLLGTWDVLTQMAPYLIFGFFVAGLLSVLISPSFIERHLGHGRFLPTLKSATFGIPLPLCSCGVIPVSASLRKHGASKGATSAFLIATPQTGVDSIMVTLSLLGPVFAVFRAVAALVSGLVGGVAVDLFGAGRGESETKAPACEDACCTGEKAPNPIVRIIAYGFWTLPKDLARSLLVGLALAGLITAVLSPEFVKPFAQDHYLPIMLGMLVVGIPLYVCATASVPIAAALVLAGVSPGAALVFLMTGPATNAATVATLWKFLGRRTTVIYILVVMTTALGSGLVLDWLFFEAGRNIAAPEHMHEMIPSWLGATSAVFLLGLLVAAIVVPRFIRADTSEVEATPETKELAIKGMTCSHCADSVRKALECVRGVESVSVDLERGKALVGGRGFDTMQLRRVVEQEGYTVET